MHLTEKKSLTSGEPNQMNQAAKPLHTHTHTTARPQRTDLSMGRRGDLDSRDSIRPLAQLPVTEQNRGGWKMQEDFGNTKNKESNGSKNTMEENSLNSGSTAVEESSDQPVERERERERRAAPPRMVDVDASRPEGCGRAKSNHYNKDPRVADYESAEEVMELFLNA